MQRLGVIDRAAEFVRELVADAEPVDHPKVTNATALQVGDIVLVLDSSSGVVQTVFRDYDAAAGEVRR
jgi:hypothetical protein